MSSLLFTSLLLFSSILSPIYSSVDPSISSKDTASHRPVSDAFIGFSTSNSTQIWDEQPWRDVAIPLGFDALSVYDYSDVGVLINNNSEVSRTIGWAFVEARNISQDRVFVFNDSQTPSKETINRDEFNTYFAGPFLSMLSNVTADLNYLVTTKGIPLRINGGGDKASFDQEISLLGGIYNSSVGVDNWFNHGYGPLAGGEMEAFSRENHGFFLVTRLTGYTMETALQLIEKANNSLGQRGIFALDLAPGRNTQGYQFWNDDLERANSTLNGSMGLPTNFDQSDEFLTNLTNVMGYASWGSNDDSWTGNELPNGGFDVQNASWSSGVDLWNATVPTLSAGDTFNWSYQTDTKQDGNGAIEASISAVCTAESGSQQPGIYAEYFDNDGVSFNAASMPLLIDRFPDHVRIESNLQYGSSSQAYPGLDDRFKNNWGARFSGLITIPEAGNWTFYLTTDDGSEMWLDGQSLIQNYGSHGMREISNWKILDEGVHDFRIEFFQGGGPHGLQFSWEGPNQTKSFIPPSAFTLAGGYVPSPSSLIHQWDFEDGSGGFANDSVNSSTNLTLNNMNSTNWKNCPDGKCLWFDGIDDSVEVDVNDWVGNFTISQWVWANSSSLPNYASTFAVDDSAGSNGSFQHMVYNGQWRMHTNQTYAFGDVESQRWTHLVTVFETGTARQYLDGVLVRTTAVPSGSLNNFELYKMGVNRGGSTFFQGMIDKVQVWDTALMDSEITTLQRDIYHDCSAYSGNGQSVASLENIYPISGQFENHKWLIDAYGMRIGDVYGDFTLEIEGIDSNGSVLSINASNQQIFGTGWESTTLRFQPHENATHLRIRIPLDLVATSTDGSVFIDSLRLYPLRPHNQWVNGSIAETAVSTGARSFEFGTSYGQSLVADLLEDGVSGVKGYVYEPYLQAVGSPSMLMSMYATGFNLAESHAAANLQSGWMGVTVGDPKMAPYADRFHDINLIDIRQTNNASYLQPTHLQIAIENRGMAFSNGSLLVQDIQGNIEMHRGNISLNSGDMNGSRILYNITIVPEKTGWMDLRIRYTNASSDSFERQLENNLLTLRVWVNSPPVVSDAYCDSELYSRGDNFICTVEASDDINVTSVTIQWAVVEDSSNLSEVEWYSELTGKVDSDRWQASVTLPANLSLGSLVLRASAFDESQQVGLFVNLEAATVVDALAQWFGPHLSGVDSLSWSGANQLQYQPLNGLLRGNFIDWKVCVLDADFDIQSQQPLLFASSGSVSNATYESQSDTNHHCYKGIYELEVGANLDDIEFEVRNTEGLLLSSRNIQVTDLPPQASMEFRNQNGDLLDSLRGGGNEFVHLNITDFDDPFSSVSGDVMIQWPGADALTLPVDAEDTRLPVIIELTQINTPLEAGNFLIELDVIGQHGARLQQSSSLPFLLTTPEILGSQICDSLSSVGSLRFGSTAFLLVHLDSDRPIQSMQVSLNQLGWSVDAPLLENDAVGLPTIDSCYLNEHPVGLGTFYWFRLRLDGTFIDGEGQINLMIRDIDGLSKSLNIVANFFHAAPSVSLPSAMNVTAGDILTLNATVEDADGLDDLLCSSVIRLESGTVLADLSLQVEPLDSTSGLLTVQFPTSSSENDSQLLIDVTCVDQWLQSNTSSIEVTLNASPACTDCEIESAVSEEQSDLANSRVYIVLGISTVIIFVSLLILGRKKGPREPIEWEKSSQTSLTELDSMDEDKLKRPDGWSIEQYRSWLEGEMPSGWTLLQWMEFSDAQLELLQEDSIEREELMSLEPLV